MGVESGCCCVDTLLRVTEDAEYIIPTLLERKRLIMISTETPETLLAAIRGTEEEEAVIQRMRAVWVRQLVRLVGRTKAAALLGLDLEEIPAREHAAGDILVVRRSRHCRDGREVYETFGSWPGQLLAVVHVSTDGTVESIREIGADAWQQDPDTNLMLLAAGPPLTREAITRYFPALPFTLGSSLPPSVAPDRNEYSELIHLG